MPTIKTRAGDMMKHVAARDARVAATKQLEYIAKIAYYTEDAILHAALDAFIERNKEAKTAESTFKSLPKKRRNAAVSAVQQAELYARRIANNIGGVYSGKTTHAVQWGDNTSASTSTRNGDRYSRRCSYRKTNATHTICLNAEDILTVLDNAEVATASDRDCLPLLSYSTKLGAARWLKARNKQLAIVEGFIAYDAESRLCHHSEISLDHAERGLEIKLGYWRAIQEKAKQRKKDERRASLIARLCPTATATIEDAKRLGFCEPGIRAFQEKHNIGDEAKLSALLATKDDRAIMVAIEVARQMKRSAPPRPACEAE